MDTCLSGRKPPVVTRGTSRGCRIGGFGIVLIGALLLAHPSHAQQQMYKSVGPDGRIIYSDRPPAEGKLEKTITYYDQPSSGLSPQVLAYLDQLKQRGAASKAPSTGDGTVLYMAKWCGYCRQAKAFLASKNIPYREFDIDTQEGLAAFASAGGGKGVPLLIHGGTRVRGFSAATYETVFAKPK
jgi:glutaredoxin